MPVRFLLAPSADLAKTVDAHVTIEAEYGSVVAEGSQYTAAHHQESGPYAGSHVVEGGRPAPCRDENIPVLDPEEDSIVLLSHFDLDTLGGCLRTLAERAGFFGGRLDSFWNLAEFVDTHGPHRLQEAEASEWDKESLYAFWAWSKQNRLGRMTEVTDITTFINEAEVALRLILMGDSLIACPEGDALRAAGRSFRDAEFGLNRDSFVEVVGVNVLLRSSEQFVNHLYSTVDGEAFVGVVAFNPEKGSVTVSMADSIPGISCRKIVQDLWGPEAGGHDGIAGSPRERQMTLNDARKAATALHNILDSYGGRKLRANYKVYKGGDPRNGETGVSVRATFGHDGEAHQLRFPDGRTDWFFRHELLKLGKEEA